MGVGDALTLAASLFTGGANHSSPLNTALNSQVGYGNRPANPAGSSTKPAWEVRRCSL
jgi:hypothetical protein